VTTQAATLPSTPVAASRRPSWAQRVGDLLLHAVVQDRVLTRIYPGIMHFMLFWGVSIQILGTIVNLLQYPLFLPFIISWPKTGWYLGFELVMDIAGGMILVGVLMAALRRLFFRPKYLVNRWEDWAALILLAAIAILGFLTEAVRLAEVQPAWRAWSPIGSFTASVLRLGGPVGQAIHGWLLAGHVVVALALLAIVPYTKMRHLFVGPLNIFVRPHRNSGELDTIEDVENAEKLGVGVATDFSAPSLVSFDACVQCGRCESVCPATISGMPYNPRTLILDLYHDSQKTFGKKPGVEARAVLDGSVAKETPWMCTTCGHCVQVCPLFIDPPSAVIDLRRYMTMTTGDVPGSVGEALTQMERRGNPWGIEKSQRAPWVAELGVRVLQPGEETDVLLFVGCAYAYDARSQKAGRELATLLKQAGIQFAVLVQAEGCCGETARRLGHEYLFQTMAKENLATFAGVKFKRMVTACAHCYNTLKNEYPKFGASFEVLHHTELLAQLVKQGKLGSLTAPKDGRTVVFHDSCYLGRYNGLYAEPRAVLDAIPGMKTKEMPRNRADGFCCGGGGGGMWMETDPNTRINKRRFEEATQRAGADVIVTACPYCLIMFDDAIRTAGATERVQVKDLAEVLTERRAS
jgi:Fe-S oxidoreductase/nitrate reductase gamma subunit